jgi:hypothetical protein
MPYEYWVAYTIVYKPLFPPNCISQCELLTAFSPTNGDKLSS